MQGSCRLSSLGEIFPSDASRKRGNRSGQEPEFSAGAVQHEGVITQASSRSNSEVLERTKESSENIGNDYQAPVDSSSSKAIPAKPGTRRDVKLTLWDPSEVGGSCAPNQPGLHFKTLSQVNIVTLIFY